MSDENLSAMIGSLTGLVSVVIGMVVGHILANWHHGGVRPTHETTKRIPPKGGSGAAPPKNDDVQPCVEDD